MRRTGWLALGFVAGAMAVHLWPTATASESPYGVLDTFAEVYGHLMRDHVDPVDPAVILEGAIRGMAGALDPHTTYLDADAVRRFHEDGAGEFAGVGMEVAERDGRLVVVAPLPGTPADRAGVRSGDQIVAVDGAPTARMGLEDLVGRLRGAVGSPVILTIQSDGVPARDVRLERALIRVDPAVGELVAPGIALIRLRLFQKDTADHLEAHLLRLRQGRVLEGVILDLRDNPGGLLDEAIDVADRFLVGGEVVRTRDRRDGESWRADASTLTPAPMVVLVNGGSASAAEIVAGALQDHGRATIAGQPTFGKGSVQRLYPLAGGAGLKLTVARYFTPNGRSIQAKGITPDVVWSAADARPRTREADLPGALDKPRGSGDKGPMQAAPDATDADPWVARAIALLTADR